MKTTDRERELWTIFAGRDRVVDLGQWTAAQRRRLQWGVRRGLVMSCRAPWPWFSYGTAIKRWYYRNP